MRAVTYLTIVLFASLTLGCSSAPEPSAPVQLPDSLSPSSTSETNADTAASSDAPATEDAAATNDVAPEAESPQPESNAAEAPAEPMPSNTPSEEATPERVKAEKGVGVKGRSLDEYEGMIVTPAKAYFSVRERVVFEVQIPKAVQLFEATNGRLPNSHEEFMEQIIKANMIDLPELPAGQRYIFDEKTKELMVEH